MVKTKQLLLIKWTVEGTLKHCFYNGVSCDVMTYVSSREYVSISQRLWLCHKLRWHHGYIYSSLTGLTVEGGFFYSLKERKKNMIRQAIIKLANKEDLTYEMAEAVMDEIMSGYVPDLQIGAYLVALSMKGETIDEITASAKGMRNHAVKLLHDLDVLEIVGTGGDKSNSFNISTTTAIVV